MAAPSTPSTPGAPANPLLDPAVQANPYALYAMLRKNNPVFRLPVPVETGAGVFALTRHADVEAVLRDTEHRFSVQRRKGDLFRLYRDQLPAVLVDGPGGAQSMLMQDPPAHTRLRGLVSKAFTPRRVAELAPRVEALVAKLVDEALAKGETDWIHDLAEPLPAVVIAELLGVPPEDHRTFQAWSSQLIDSVPAFGFGGREQVESSVSTILDYLRKQIALRRAEPTDDLLSGLIEAQEEQDALSDDELVSTAFLLLLAGHETTTNLIGNGLLALLRHPDAWDHLRGHPERVDHAVEELLRYDSPVQATVRIPVEDVAIGGHEIGKGAMVICGIGAANRDPDVHPEPDRLDLERDPIRHLSFGFGTHFCLGASLARLEGRAVFRALADRVKSIERVGDTLAYRANPILRGLKSLPVRLH